MKRLNPNNVFSDFPYKGHSLIKKVKYTCYAFKLCWQRITKGYCDRDVWNLRYWFLQQMPHMIQELKETKHGYPGTVTIEEWDNILNRMTFLFKEADEDTCSKKNPYQKEWDKAQDEFEDKYGFFGEKLNDKNEMKGLRTLHMMGELPEYKEIDDKWFKAEEDIRLYQEKCLKEGFELFVKWFDALWD